MIWKKLKKKVQLFFHNVARRSKMVYRLGFYSSFGEALKRAWNIFSYKLDIGILETLAWWNYSRG